VEDFDVGAIADRARQGVAQRVRVVHDGSPDDNALAPVQVTVRLFNGDRYCERVEHILGHPHNPLSREQYLEKFRQCCRSAARPVQDTVMNALIAACDQLEALPDARVLMDHMAG
jgi:2-methylcitrate dehydratase PrpD